MAEKSIVVEINLQFRGNKIIALSGDRAKTDKY